MNQVQLRESIYSEEIFFFALSDMTLALELETFLKITAHR